MAKKQNSLTNLTNHETSFLNPNPTPQTLTPTLSQTLP